MMMSDISKNMKQLGIARDLSQAQLAEKVNVTRQTVSSWERGNSNPDVDMLLKIAEVLETDVNDLLYPQGFGGKRRRIEPLTPKFVILSVLFYFVLLIFGGINFAVPLLSALFGYSIMKEHAFMIIWGLILLVGYLAICTCLISEYISDAVQGQ